MNVSLAISALSFKTSNVISLFPLSLQARAIQRVEYPALVPISKNSPFGAIGYVMKHSQSNYNI